MLFDEIVVIDRRLGLSSQIIADIVNAAGVDVKRLRLEGGLVRVYTLYWSPLN